MRRYGLWLFFVIAIGTHSFAASAQETTRLKNINADRCLSVDPATNNRDGGIVTMATCFPSDNQRWIIQSRRVGGSVQLKNVATSRCLNVHGRDQRDGGAITVYSCADTEDQYWYIHRTAEGQVKPKNRVSQLCLNVHGRSHNYENAPATVFACAEGAQDQVWRFIDPNIDDIAEHWEGRYTGRFNGRPLIIDVAVHHLEANGIVYTFRFHDTERNVHYAGITLVPYGTTTHRIENLRMQHPGNRNEFFQIERLFLHAKNRNVLSGVYRSSGGDWFGIAAARDGFTSSASLNRAASNLQKCEWAGLYGGFLNGKPARLEASASRLCGSASIDGRQFIHLELTDFERGTTFTGRAELNRNRPHELSNIRLENAEGGDIQIPILVMHIWNTNYLSGRYGTRDFNYGMTFRRLEPEATTGRNLKSREGCQDCPSAGSSAANIPPSVSVGQSCDSDEVGDSCMALPRECVGSGADLLVPGTNMCRNGRIVCDTSASRGDKYCTGSSPSCGRQHGAPCASSNQCVPGSSCQRGRCLPISNCIVSVSCWKPSDLTTNNPALCRATDNIPEVPYNYTECLEQEHGTECKRPSIVCPDVELTGVYECHATSRHCAVMEPPRCPEPMPETPE